MPREISINPKQQQIQINDAGLHHVYGIASSGMQRSSITISIYPPAGMQTRQVLTLHATFTQILIGFFRPSIKLRRGLRLPMDHKPSSLPHCTSPQTLLFILDIWRPRPLQSTLDETLHLGPNNRLPAARTSFRPPQVPTCHAAHLDPISHHTVWPPLHHRPLHQTLLYIHSTTSFTPTTRALTTSSNFKPFRPLRRCSRF